MSDEPFDLVAYLESLPSYEGPLTAEQAASFERGKADIAAGRTVPHAWVLGELEAKERGDKAEEERWRRRIEQRFRLGHDDPRSPDVIVPAPPEGVKVPDAHLVTLPDGMRVSASTYAFADARPPEKPPADGQLWTDEPKGKPGP